MKGGPCASLQLLQADLELSQVNITNLFVGDNKYSHHRRPTGGSAIISFPSFSYNDLEEMSRHSYFIFTNNLLLLYDMAENECTRNIIIILQGA